MEAPRFIRILPMLVFLIFILSCSGGEMQKAKSSLPSIKDVRDVVWQKLSEKTIFFGHQSVGDNILEGVKDLLKKNPQIKINIIQTMDSSDIQSSCLNHFWVGNNMDTKSKIDGFVDYMGRDMNNSSDIAFFKFCFVDITAETDVEKVFSDYKITMSELAKIYPKTTFVHVTVPLTCMPEGFEGLTRRGKNIIKRIIGRPVFDLSDNRKRCQYNELLRKEYQGKAPVFDLASIESTFPDGKRVFSSKEEKTCYPLVPDYTYDGGHLNTLGSQIAAEQLLIFLANLSNR